MSTSVRAKKLSFDRDTMWVELDDGRSLGVPLAWFPRLMRGERGRSGRTTASAFRAMACTGMNSTKTSPSKVC